MRASIALVLAACGSSGTKATPDARALDAPAADTRPADAAFSGAVMGTIHGQTLVPQSVISAKITLSNGNTLAEVLLDAKPDLCSDIANGIERSSDSSLAIFIEDKTAHTAPTSPGTITIAAPTGLSASSSFIINDSACHDVTNLEAYATSGTITLAAVAGDTFTGSFDTTLDSGDHLTGTFTPEPCTALQSSPTNVVCTP